MSIASDGYVLVHRCVDSKTLDALREEADHLFKLKDEKNTLSEDDYFENGCTLDLFTKTELSEKDEARISMEKYMLRRNNGGRDGNKVSLRSKGADEEPSTNNPNASVQTKNGQRTTTNDWTERHVSILQGAIFQTLARLARDALTAYNSARGNTGVRELQATSITPAEVFPGCGPNGTDRPPSHSTDTKHNGMLLSLPASHNSAGHQRSATSTPSSVSGMKRPSCLSEGGQASKKLKKATTSQDGQTDPLFLFNEQYVVKPPMSSIEFGWHTDEQEQLAMCIIPPGVQPPVYVSIWLALDDCDALNGCLEVCSQAWDSPKPHPPREGDGQAVLCIPANAGDAVVFLSNLWHRSGPNRTAKPRRVFYSQFTTDIIRATPADPQPLRLAIPCPSVRV